MANKKKEVFKPGPMTEGKREIIRGLLQEYDIESAADIQEALINARPLWTGSKKPTVQASSTLKNVQLPSPTGPMRS